MKVFPSVAVIAFALAGLAGCYGRNEVASTEGPVGQAPAETPRDSQNPTYSSTPTPPNAGVNIPAPGDTQPGSNATPTTPGYDATPTTPGATPPVDTTPPADTPSDTSPDSGANPT